MTKVPTFVTVAVMRRLHLTATCLCLCALVLGTATCSSSQPSGPPEHSVTILAELPHDAGAFTQGLFFHDGWFYESTGQYGSSTVRIIDPASGHVRRSRSLMPDQFGEGLAKLGSAAIQLTWKQGTGIVYDLKTLEPLKTFRYQGEGWGLAASDGNTGGTPGEVRLIMSNGSAQLTFLNPATLAAMRSVRVHDNGVDVNHLNELEWMDNLLLANIWMQDKVAAIDPETGAVRAWIDLAPLRKRLPKSAGVANGIAYDAQSETLYMTGKNWNKLFAVQITPPLQ